MTISLEHIEPDDWYAVERMRQKLQALVLDTGGLSVGIRFGTLTLSWTTGGFSSATTSGVLHGLGRVPVVVGVFPISTGMPEIVYAHGFSLAATTFSAAGACRVAAAANTSITCGWIAVG